jgi:hypothetical protein
MVNLKLFVFKMNERESIESVKKNLILFYKICLVFAFFYFCIYDPHPNQTIQIHL